MNENKKGPVLDLRDINLQGLTEKLQGELRRAESTKREKGYDMVNRSYDLSSAPSYGDVT